MLPNLTVIVSVYCCVRLIEMMSSDSVPKLKVPWVLLCASAIGVIMFSCFQTVKAGSSWPNAGPVGGPATLDESEASPKDLFADVLRKARGASGANEAISVVFAAGNILSTAEIKDSMLETRMIPRSLAPKMVFSDIKEVAGRVASVSIPQGMPIVPEHLAPKGTPPGLGARIRDGFRAVAVKVDESSGVAGWLKPGCRVDVVAVLQVEGTPGERRTISKVILENIEVLAVGQDSGADPEVKAAVTKSVTLAVAPADVPKLHLATTQGTVRLAMRNSQDDSKATTQEADNYMLGVPGNADRARRGPEPPGPTDNILARLLKNQPKESPKPPDKTPEASPGVQPAPPPQVPVWRIEVLTGQQREEVLFDDKTNDARRVDGKADRRSVGLGSALTEKRTPAPAGSVVKDALPAHGEPPRPTESRE